MNALRAALKSAADALSPSLHLFQRPANETSGDAGGSEGDDALSGHTIDSNVLHWDWREDRYPLSPERSASKAGYALYDDRTRAWVGGPLSPQCNVFMHTDPLLAHVYETAAEARAAASHFSERRYRVCHLDIRLRIEGVPDDTPNAKTAPPPEPKPERRGGLRRNA